MDSLRIIFIRHGQPDFDTRMWVGRGDVTFWLNAYQNARVTQPPEQEILNLGDATSGHVVTSGLLRAQDSLRLCLQCENEVSALLNEADLPHPRKLPFPLPWRVLVIICRVFWLLGYRSNAPGRRCDFDRARKAANLLEERAAAHLQVFVIGHGLMIRLMVRALKKNGWNVVSDEGGRYWARTELCLTSEC